MSFDLHDSRWSPHVNPEKTYEAFFEIDYACCMKKCNNDKIDDNDADKNSYNENNKADENKNTIHNKFLRKTNRR